MKELINFVKKINLPGYHTRTLSYLLMTGRMKATELAKVADVPRTRIYDVLEDLFKMGLVKYKPGRPSIFQSINIEDIPEKLILWKKKKTEEEINELKNLQEDIKTLSIPTYNSNMKELLNMILVGIPSEMETRKIIENAKREINVVSHAFEHYGRLKENIINAYRRNVRLRVLLAHPNSMDVKYKERQKSLKKWMKRDMPRIEIKMFNGKIPIKATIADPDIQYKTGSAIFIVEQKEIPLFMREAAVTHNPSLVYGLKNYFDHLWESAQNEL